MRICILRVFFQSSNWCVLIFPSRNRLHRRARSEHKKLRTLPFRCQSKFFYKKSIFTFDTLYCWELQVIIHLVGGYYFDLLYWNTSSTIRYLAGVDLLALCKGNNWCNRQVFLHKNDVCSMWLSFSKLAMKTLINWCRCFRTIQALVGQVTDVTPSLTCNVFRTVHVNYRSRF